MQENLHYRSKRLPRAERCVHSARHAHAAAGNQVDAKLFAQAINLRRAQPV
jgi:hypothetical protein